MLGWLTELNHIETMLECKVQCKSLKTILLRRRLQESVFSEEGLDPHYYRAHTESDYLSNITRARML